MIMDRKKYAELEAAAKKTALNAYSPYSGFRVGAAVLAASGVMYTGANVENASYGLTLCAERAALAAALSAGERKIVAICLACIDVAIDVPIEKRVPCGACRQWLQEVAPDADILIVGAEHPFKIKELLPIPFSLSKPR